GADYARFLNEQGIAGLFLRTGLGRGGIGLQAFLMIPAEAFAPGARRAEDWRWIPNAMGFWGPSPGGILPLLFLLNSISERPRRQIRSSGRVRARISEFYAMR